MQPFFFILSVFISSVSSQLATFTAGTPIQNLIYDDTSKRIFLGGTNQIIRLNDKLEKIRDKSTGPVMDNEECYYGGCDTKVKTDNENKILLISNGILVYCGSIYGGKCNGSDMTTLKDTIYDTTFDNTDPFWTASIRSNTLAVSSGGLNNNEGLFVAVEKGYQSFQLGNGMPFISSYYLNVAQSSQMFQRVPNGRMRMTETTKLHHIFAKVPYFYVIGKRASDVDPFISRTCQGDVGRNAMWARVQYNSYMDLKFKCQSESNSIITKYSTLTNFTTGSLSNNLALSLNQVDSQVTAGNQVLIGLFYDDATATYAVCPYPLPSLDKKFDAKADKSGSNCNVGMNDGQRSLDTTISLSPVATFTNVSVTSLLLFTVKDKNVLVLGTKSGGLLKVVLGGGGPTAVTGRPTPLMSQALWRLDSSETVLFGISGGVSTWKTVFAEPLGRCEKFSTCETCVRSGDPFCGWCLLKAGCMQYSECSGTVSPTGETFNSDLWVDATAPGSDQCFPITDMSPTYARINKTSSVEATATQLVYALDSRNDVQCVFEAEGSGRTLGLGSPARMDNGRISCNTPELDPTLDPSLLAEGSDNLVVTVRLKLRDGSTPFMSLFTGFPLYYCPSNTECYTCTTSPFDCKWCKDSNRCLQLNEPCGANLATTASGIKVEQWGQCPQLLPANYTVEVRGDGGLEIDVSNILMSTEGDYKCNVPVKGGAVRQAQAVSRQTSADQQTIQCTVPVDEMVVSSEPRYIPLVVTYKSVPILNPNNTAQMILYSCQSIPDCSSCKALDVKYACTWCRSTSQCMRSVDCEPENQVTEDRCSDPGPIIKQVTPTKGPLSGGTVVTLEGSDLFIRYSDLYNITVAGIDCELQQAGCIVSTRAVCKTRAVSGPLDGPIVLSSVNGQASFQTDNFFYCQAVISKVEPTVVLKSGGTYVTIAGTQLDMGSNVTVMLGVSACNVISTGSTITCRTRAILGSQQGMAETGGVTVQIDGAVYTAPDQFTYIDVPQVKTVTPTDSIASGGIAVTLQGTRGFDSITSAQLYLTNEDVKSSPTTCMASISDTQIVCVTPRIEGSSSIGDTGQRMDMSLRLEDFSEVKILYVNLRVYPDPVIDVEDMDTNISAGEPLVITGKFFNRVRGISVDLNGTKCAKLEVSDTIITCTVPDLLNPAPQDGDGSITRRRRRRQSDEGSADDNVETIEKAINITVRLGAFVSDPIPATFTQEIIIEGNIMGIIGACAAAGVVVVLLLAAVCLLHKRKLQQKKQFKHFMLQEMERIELRLAEECKQVFTELQTDLADLNSDFSPATIPYHSFDEYALKVLFPAQDDYPVLSDPPELESMEMSLKVFDGLMRQENFLLTLVETLDGQRQVSKRDKSNIAALMMVSLMDDMSYTTTILKQLLSKLISDTVNSDRRIKLLLRRSEHITEKFLSNWLTFNLHPFLRESAGQPLYVLYRAIKQQIEKGPVDYITGNARYALHEKNMLSRITDFTKLNIMVYLEDDPYLKDTPYTPLSSCQVSLLSCDTVSQAKAKIIDAMYRTVPDSLKPTHNDVDVEWKNGTSSSLRLVDMLHNSQDGWKQLETLGTLNVENQAVFECIPRQSPPPFMTQSGGAPSCNSLLREIENGRVWHLERDVDNEAEGGKGMTVPEVFLTRLSATKIPLQKFVDDLFNVIFTPNEGITSLPPCVKFLMDFLDAEAAKHQILDPETLHTWKNNALPLRFWISVLKSPDVVFDVRKNNNIDSCLSVIAQTFIDATLYEDMTIDKTSQSSRLLYCKEIPVYKQHVREFYGEIQTCRPVTEAEVEAAFARHRTPTKLRRTSALLEMLGYASRFSEEVLEALNDKGLRDLADQFAGISDSGEGRLSV